MSKDDKKIILSSGKIIVKESTYNYYGEKLLRAVHGMDEHAEIIIIKGDDKNARRQS